MGIIFGILAIVLFILFILGLGRSSAEREQAHIQAFTIHQMETQFRE